MLKFLEAAQDKIEEVLESEMVQLMKAHADVLEENKLLKSALEKANDFSEETTYNVKYKGEVHVVFHITPLTTGHWHVVSSSANGFRSMDAVSKLAAVKMVDEAIADPQHELVRDHLS